MKLNPVYIARVLYYSGNPTAFFTALEGVANRLGISFEWLCNAIYCESEFKPKAKNPSSTASGLIQMLDSNCRAYAGCSYTDFLKKSNIEQLPGIENYLRAMIKSCGKPKDWIDTYCLIFQPAWVGKSDSATLSSNAYSGNAFIDANKDKKVTKGEFRIWANKRLPPFSLEEVKKRSPI